MVSKRFLIFFSPRREANEMCNTDEIFKWRYACLRRWCFRAFPWYLWWLSLSSAALDKKLWKNGSKIPQQTPIRFSGCLLYSFSYEESRQPWTWSRGEAERCKVWCLLNPVCTGRDSSPASSDDMLRVVELHSKSSLIVDAIENCF